MKRIISLLLTAAIICCLPSCELKKKNTAMSITEIPEAVTLAESDALRGKKIGCSIVYKGDEWCATLATAFELMAKRYGAELVCEDGDLNDETQTKQIENMIANGCDMIFIDPVTPDGSTVALKKACESKIPIIIYDSYWAEDDDMVITNVTWDNYKTGLLMGEYFSDFLKKNGMQTCRVLELGNFISTHTQDRFEGVHDKLGEDKTINCKVISKLDTQGNRELAYNAVTSVVEPFDFIITDTDNSAMGASTALQALGRPEIGVFSLGGYGSESFDMVHENDPNYISFVNIDPWVLAKIVFDSAIRYYNGEKNEKTVYIDQFVIDSSNCEKFWTFEEKNEDGEMVK